MFHDIRKVLYERLYSLGLFHNWYIPGEDISFAPTQQEIQSPLDEVNLWLRGNIIFGDSANKGINIENLRGIFQVDIFCKYDASNTVDSYKVADLILREFPSGLLIELLPDLVMGGPTCLRVTKTGYLSPLRYEKVWAVLSISIPFELLLSEEVLKSMNKL